MQRGPEGALPKALQIDVQQTALAHVSAPQGWQVQPETTGMSRCATSILFSSQTRAGPN